MCMSAINKRKWGVTLGVILAAAAPAVGTSGAAASVGCANADVTPISTDQVVHAEHSTRCLVNAERHKRGLHSLRFNADLQQSSDWQAGDMFRHAYFDHQRPGGPSFTQRILRFGYARGANGYSLGENLAWSTSDGASPREIVALWMHSRGHRSNILRRKFRDQAVTAVLANGNDVGGDYADAGPIIIYVNQFGAHY